MLKNFFDGLLSIFIILSFAFLVIGNIARFVYWVKCRKTCAGADIHYYSDFWNNEWGTECTKEEIEELHQIIKQFEEKHIETDHKNFEN